MSNEDRVPPQAPPPVPPPFPPYAVTPPPPPKRKSQLLPLIGIFFVLWAVASGAWKAQSTDVVVDGKSLSREEVREGLSEIAEMGKAARPGDPASFGEGKSPTTKLGQQMLKMTQKFAAHELATAQELGDDSLDKIFEPKLLGTDKGRLQCRKTVAHIDKTYSHYFVQLREDLDDVDQWVNSMGGKRKVNIELREHFKTIEQSLQAITAKANEMLDFVDRVKPHYNPKSGKLDFQDPDIPLFTERYNAFVASATKFVEAQEELQKFQKESLKHSLEIMQ